jgi:hypothetical protein
VGVVEVVGVAVEGEEVAVADASWAMTTLTHLWV